MYDKNSKFILVLYSLHTVCQFLHDCMLEIIFSIDKFTIVIRKNCCFTEDSNSCQSPESGALSLASAARHIDFHSSHRIYAVLVAHSIALSLHYFYYTRVFKFRLVHKTNYLIYYQNFFALIAIWVTVYNILHSIQICFCVTILEKYICGIVC